MKVEEIIKKISNMNSIEKLDFLFKIYNEVEEKEELEKLINDAMKELSSERTPVNIELSFRDINKENKNKSEIEEKINSVLNEQKENKEYQAEYINVKFIPEEDVVFWVEGKAPAKKYYKPPETKKYEVVW